MTSPDNILLYLAPSDEQQVRAIFEELEARGFPKQNQTPHITITFAPRMSEPVVQRAAELLPPVVPAEFRRVGTVVFGTKSKRTVAWLLETSDELEIAARQISAANPDGRGSRWIPHLTVGLRLPKDLIPAYLDALEEVTSSHFKKLRAHRAALWRPASRELRVLAGGESPSD